MNFLFLIYDIVFILGFIIHLPFSARRKKINLKALKQKLGFIPRMEGRSIWIQAVSVGEVNLIEGLVKRLKEIFDYPLVISTTTLTGNKVARKKYANLAKVFFFPLDVSFILKKVLRLINPRIFIAVETEIWPNLFFYLARKNIPIVIINGRISRRAFRRYRLIKPVLKKVLSKCNYIGVQNNSYRQKFLHLEMLDEKIVVSGNMKFESISIDENSFLKVKEKYLPILKKEGSLLIIAASTHMPEEEIILNVYQELKKTEREIRLLIAPRHPERIPLIEKIVADFGFYPVRLSKIAPNFKEENVVFLLDTMGELLYFYALSDICFVGGSLIKHGGHNILEPIYFLKPTVFGPYMENFADIVEITLTRGAGIKVRSARELKEIILRLIRDEALRNNLRSKCLGVFEEEKKAYEKNLEIILKCL